MDFIDDLSLIQKIYLFEIYLSVSFWEYVTFQKKTNAIRYNIEYGYYSLIQWLAIAARIIFYFWHVQRIFSTWILFDCVTIPVSFHPWINIGSDFEI